MKEKLYPEAFLLRMPAGTVGRLRLTARRYGQSVTEYVRQLIRQALDDAEGPPRMR